MINIAVLISDKGTGTNLQAIIDGIKDDKINGKIAVVVSDTPKAFGLKRARKNNVKIEICPEKNQLIAILKKYQPDFIACAGWKQIITNNVIDAFSNKILNLHPGFIPDKKTATVKNPDGSDALWNRGLLAEKAVNNFLVNQASYAGSSVHFLTYEFDFGPVLARGFVKTKKNDTVASLYSRIKKKEHEIYVKVLQNLSKNKKATVLVIDDGGRAAALVYKYAQSKHVGKILVVPGNDLIKINTKKPLRIFPHLKTTSAQEIIEIAKRNKVDLVDVAQDNAVAVGLVDALTENGIRTLGPTKLAGQIEWDKAWAREFMKRHNIAHPRYKVFSSRREGINYLRKQQNTKWFIKASGLTYGKGVYGANNNKEAINRIDQLKQFKDQGETYLIEECLIGEEFSSYAISDGTNFKIIGHAQDNKRALNFDEGENTGGIGASSPPMVLNNKNIVYQINQIFKKTIDGLRKEGRPYVGVLYLGGMITVGKNPKVYVIEFNARWGDPEVEAVLPTIKNDLYEIAIFALQGNLKKLKIEALPRYVLVVTAVPRGYPNDYSQAKDKEIFGIPHILKLKDVIIFGAGIKEKKGKYFVGAGRLLHIAGIAKNAIDARRKAYEAISILSIDGNNLHYRTDIGWRDVARFYKK